MDTETELTDKEFKEVMDICRLNKQMTFPRAKELYLKKLATQKRLI